MKTQSSTPSRRIWLMDEIRGFAVFCMIFYHAFYSLSSFFHISFAEKLLLFFMPIEPFFAGIFIFISGISSQLSRSNFKRGAILLGIALGVSLVTFFFDANAFIAFGILHFLSVCMLLFALLKPILNRISPVIGILGCILFYLLTMQIKNKIFAFFILLPDSLYEAPFLFPFGIYNSEFFSADYFPLLPWVFVFFAGAFLGQYAAKGNFPAFTFVSRIPFFSWMGRHALILYLVHQPIIFALTWLLTRI